MTLCQIVLVALMLLVSFAVACRLFGGAFELAEEIAGYLLVALTFLSLAGCAVHDAFHRMELVTARLRPRPFRVVRIGFVLVSLAATLVLDWYLLRFVVSSYASGNVAPTTLATPLWIPEAVMPFGITLLALALFGILRREIGRAGAPDAPG
jgi:TRAP-type C4-dicarboxylate transport system permease small subunit